MTIETQSIAGAASDPHDYVITSTDGPVGIVTLNRPKQLNALSVPLASELATALEEHDANPAIGAIVVTGGPDVFAAGADIKEMADASPIDMLLHHNPAPLWDRLRRLTKPVIAAVAGYALGGGCELAMACDIIVAADTARFGQPEINLGLIPGGGGTQRLTRSIGKSLAMDVILSGRMLTADEVLAHGLAARVVPHDTLLAEAVKLGKQIASKGPVAVRFARASVTRAFEGRVDDGLELERDLFFLLFSTRDAHEGMHAFIEKRQPTFEGA
jgi:enoyl-CoA hydratase